MFCFNIYVIKQYTIYGSKRSLKIDMKSMKNDLDF